MFELLDRRTRLTGNQRKIVVAAILGDMLEFFDYFLIGFVLAFVVGPWGLTFGQSAIILLSSGIGAMLGAAFWGWLADRVGRRVVFMATIVNFSVATGFLGFTPDHGWIFLTAFRFFVGFGVGGLYCVDLPLVQEFMPASKRGFIGGLVTAFIPVGTMIGAVLGGTMTPLVGWRGLFFLGLLPALLTLLVRAWVPESPRWLMRMGRTEEARRSLAWALEVDPSTLPPATPQEQFVGNRPWSDLFRYPRSLVVSCLGNLGAQTGVYGLTLWVPTLFVLLLKVTPAQASALIIPMTVAGLIGRVSFARLSDLIGRRASGGLLGFGAAALILAAGLSYQQFVDLPYLGHTSRFMAVADRRIFFRRWRLRGCRALCGRSLAGVAADQRHGSRLWLRRPRQDHRPARPRAHRRQLQRHQAGCLARRGRPRFHLSGSLVCPCRRRLLVLWDRDAGPELRGARDRARRDEAGGRPAHRGGIGANPMNVALDIAAPTGCTRPIRCPARRRWRR